MSKQDFCECCKTNQKKALNSKYCDQCSEYIREVVMLRAHRIDARYKKVFRSLFTKLQRLSEEDRFLPRQVCELIEEEME